MTPNYYPGARTQEEIKEEARNAMFTADIVDDLKENFRSEVEDATADLTELEYLRMLNSAALELAEFAQARAREIGGGL